MKKALILFGVLPLLFFACAPAQPDHLEPYEIIPASCAAVVKINHPEQFRSDYRNSPILKSLLGSDREEKAWHRSVDTVLSLEPPPGSLLVLGSGSASEEWFLILPELPGSVDSTQTGASSTSNEYPEISRDSAGFKFRKHHNLQILSSSGRYLDQTLEQLPDTSEELEKALKALNPLAEASLILPIPAEAAGTSPEGERDKNAPSSPRWVTYDLSSGTGFLGLESMETHKGSTAVLSRLLRSQPVLPLQDNAMAIPSGTSTWLSYSLQNTEQFRENQKFVTGSANPNSQILDYAEQISLAETDKGILVVLHNANPDALEELLMPFRGQAVEFQDTQIFALQQNERIRETYAPLLDAVEDPAYYCVLGESFVFAPSLEPIQSLISDYIRKSAFDKTRVFEKLDPVLAAEASTLLISVDPEKSTLLKQSETADMLPPQILSALPKDFMVATQLNLQNSYTLSSFQLQSEALLERERPEAGELFTVALDAAVSSAPQFLKNHRDGGMDIAVQDENHVLYLFSRSGELFWKKELPGPIQGRIQQADLFRNGRLQMAFTTDTQLMVLDRNGKAVAPFPKKFAGGNLGPLAVFDYEQNRNYRLVLTQGSRVFMYDGQGREVKGFKFKNAGSPVVSIPVHIRIGSRDYLLFQLENGALRILNRVGDPRVPVKETFEFSSNPVHLYRNGFTFTERSGDLVRIDTRGRVNRTPLNLSPDHGMDATTKTLAIMDDNRFQVKTNKRELELGVYTHPKIFYLYDIIYVAVTDIQSQQVYLFRSTGAGVPGFPLEGGGQADMADMDNDRHPELVVPYRENSIRVYRVNR